MKPANRNQPKPTGRVRVDSSSPSVPRPESHSLFSFVAPAYSGRALWVCLALIAAIAAVYAPVRHYDFVNFDDPDYILENPHVLAGLTWQGVKWAFTSGSYSNWFPLTWLSHMLDVQSYGLNAGRHHLTNLLLHIANTLLLFGLFHRMTGALGRSAFVAGLFAVHPLHVESVAWVAERKDVLSTLFWLLTLWAYIGYVRQPRRDRYLAVLLLFALGLMAKPMLVTLPFVLLLLDFWPLRRVALDGGSVGAGSAPPPVLRSVGGRLAREKLPLLGLAAASSIVTFVVQRRGGSVTGLDVLPLSHRMANALLSYIAYIGEMLWPAHLAAFYPYPRSLSGWYVVGAALALIGVTIVVIQAARRHPYLPVGWFWYLGALTPVIGLVQVGTQSMADRYTYVPLIGLFVMAAWGIPDLAGRWPRRSVALPAAAVLVIALGAITARNQVGYWENSIALWTRTLAVTSENYIANNNLGIALAKQGRLSEAIDHYSEALRLHPTYAIGYNNLGNAFYRQGKLSQAIAEYSEALRLRPDYAEARNNLGVAFAAQARVDDAIAEYSEALRFNPDYAEAYNNLGNALSRQGRVDEAVAQYTAALRIQQNYAEAHSNLGGALAAEGKNNEAMREFLEAVRIDPNRADFHYNAAVMFQRIGRQAEASQQFSEANRLRSIPAGGH